MVLKARLYEMETARITGSKLLTAQPVGTATAVSGSVR
jgi:hypothetical protein